MSVIIKFKQTKDSGWTYTTELAPLGTTAIRYEDFWDSIMLSVVNDRDSIEALNSGDHDQIKKAIEKNMLEAIESFKEEMYEDLNNFVKIYPLIQKKGDKK